jgi:hypothetical protein
VEILTEIASHLKIHDFRSLVLTHRKAAALKDNPAVVARVYYNTWSVVALYVMMRENRCLAKSVVDRLFPQRRPDASTLAGKALWKITESKDTRDAHIAIVARIMQLEPRYNQLETNAAIRYGALNGFAGMVEGVLRLEPGPDGGCKLCI